MLGNYCCIHSGVSVNCAAFSPSPFLRNSLYMLSISLHLYESYANEHFRLQDLTNPPPAFVIPLQSSRKFVYSLILPVRNIWTARFLRLFFVFYDIKSKRISNRHNCDVYIRSECGSCPADVATAARARTVTHDYGRFYSYI